MLNPTNIQGWCDFYNFYTQIASWLPYDGVAVEIGVWKGQSVVHLARELKRLNKYGCRVIAVDTWLGSDEEEHRRLIDELGGTDQLYQEFLENLANSQTNDIVIPCRMESLSAVENFDNQSLDFVFIDGEHTYDAVMQDMKAWLHKIKSGGIIAGHDHDWAPVRKAVKDMFGEDYQINGNCWYKQII